MPLENFIFWIRISCLKSSKIYWGICRVCTTFCPEIFLLSLKSEIINYIKIVFTKIIFAQILKTISYSHENIIVIKILYCFSWWKRCARRWWWWQWWWWSWPHANSHAFMWTNFPCGSIFSYPFPRASWYFDKMHNVQLQFCQFFTHFNLNLIFFLWFWNNWNLISILIWLNGNMMITIFSTWLFTYFIYLPCFLKNKTLTEYKPWHDFSRYSTAKNKPYLYDYLLWILWRQS